MVIIKAIFSCELVLEVSLQLSRMLLGGADLHLLPLAHEAL
jgi:hypothetical protein